MGLNREYLHNHIAINFHIDNRRSVQDLGVAYRPISRTVLDHYAAWYKNHRHSR